MKKHTPLLDEHVGELSPKTVNCLNVNCLVPLWPSCLGPSFIWAELTCVE